MEFMEFSIASKEAIEGLILSIRRS